MKKIGILTHCIANNFGANLQALSTACFLEKRGYEPYFICWGDYLNNNTPIEQQTIHRGFLRNQGFAVSELCHTDKDFTTCIDREGIKNIIVGSDCVLTYQSKALPYKLTRRGFVKVQNNKDYEFPNPFWLPYIQQRSDIGRFLMSASSGGSINGFIPYKTVTRMKDLLSKYDYISVRDTFSKQFVKRITGRTDIAITPDPVFGFNNNISIIPSREEITKKYNLSNNYYVISFYDSNWPNQQWANAFMEEAHKKNISCVGVPMPQGGRKSDFDINLELPIDPLNWYALIKYSQGYVGNNMHPMIVALHNHIPFFSYNIHGSSLFRGRIQILRTSKEYDLLRKFNLEQNVVPQPRLYQIPPKQIVQRLTCFDTEYCEHIASSLAIEYDSMMTEIISKFK